MNKEPDMSDELTKLAEAEWLDESLTPKDQFVALRLNAHHAAEKAKAALTMSLGGAEGPKLFAINEALTALDALILTPPVDPNEAAYQEWISGYCGTFDPEETCMKFSPNEMRKAFFAGLELRTVADGGDA